MHENKKNYEFLLALSTLALEYKQCFSIRWERGEMEKGSPYKEQGRLGKLCSTREFQT